MSWIYLTLAIGAEIIATTALKISGEFSRLWPSTVAATGYAISFYFLALTLRTIPVGVAYAIWSGVGIIAIALIGAIWFHQHLSTASMVGIGLIIAGVVVLQLFSGS